MLYSYNAFKELVVGTLKKEIGEERVVEMSVDKNNGMKREGITLRVDGCRLSPIIYLNPERTMYFDEDVTEFVKQAVEEYKRAELLGSGEMSELFQWKTVKGLLKPVILNYEKNKEMLSEKYPYRRFLDLAVVCVISCDSMLGDYGNGSIKVTYPFLEQLGVDEKVLFEQAFTNMEANGYTFENLEELVARMMGEEVITGKCDMVYMLKSDEAVYGATAFISKKIMNEVCSKMDTSRVYILPASVHEILLISVPESDVEELKEMVRSINESSLPAEDYLSDNIYLYDKDTEEFEIA